MRNDCLRSEVWGANCKFTVFFTAGVFFFRDMIFMIISLLTVHSHNFIIIGYWTITGYLTKPALRYLVIDIASLALRGYLI